MNLNQFTLSQGSSGGFTFAVPEDQEGATPSLTLVGDRETTGQLGISDYVNAGSVFGCITLQGINNSLSDFAQQLSNVSGLTQMYCKALENWDAALKRAEESEKSVSSLQVLTENLRRRIAEKDRLITSLQEELNKRR